MTFRNETGRASLLSHVIPDRAYLLFIPVSVLVALPPLIWPDNRGLLWLGLPSLLLAAASSVGLALGSRPTRLIVPRADFAFDPAAADEQGWVQAVWEVPAATHHKGPYPSVQIFGREDPGVWSVREVDVSVIADATVRIAITKRVDEPPSSDEYLAVFI